MRVDVANHTGFLHLCFGGAVQGLKTIERVVIVGISGMFGMQQTSSQNDIVGTRCRGSGRSTTSGSGVTTGPCGRGGACLSFVAPLVSGRRTSTGFAIFVGLLVWQLLSCGVVHGIRDMMGDDEKNMTIADVGMSGNGFVSLFWLTSVMRVAV